MNRRGWVLVWTAACAGGCVTCAAQQHQPSARELTVELFSTRRVSTLTATPMGMGETVRMCGDCRAKPVTVPLTAKVNVANVEVRSERTREVELAGAFRMRPDGANEVSAAGLWRLRVAHSELRVLLTMDSERYVALALAGEASAKEPMESLKAMAIAVRTYALENADRHRDEGFGLCDSTHCQVLKFGEESPQVQRAVRETAGETLWYEGRRATVFYTQNCGGQSEAARSAWPGAGAPYLSSHPDPWCTRHGVAEWSAAIPLEQVLGVFRGEGWKTPAHIDTVLVTKRTGAGRAVMMEFAGNGVTMPVSASSFRFAMDRMLGWNQLRSDWFTVTLSNGVLRFEGRGYGHGVGLCQAGATEMAIEGHSAQDILSSYFPGTRIGVAADDRGWKGAREVGWTLWTTTGAAETAELVRKGNAAWAKAQSLLAPHGRVQPEVWQMPTTELFRQMTTEPGWMLASTAGTRVFLQPEAVLETGGDEETLLHEFLHVLVESDAAAQAPLWLREGVVEALAQDSDLPNGATSAVNSAALEAALTRPATEAESRWAHLAAARMAREMITHFGLEQVRQWLRTGTVPAAAFTRAQGSR